MTNNRELKHQTFSRGRRQPEVKFTSYPRFPPTGSAVATLRRLCFAYFDVACRTWVLLEWFWCFFLSFCLQFLYLVILKIFFYHFGTFTIDCQVFTHIFWTFLPPAWRWLLRNNLWWNGQMTMTFSWCVKWLLANYFSSRKAVQTVEKSGSQSRKDWTSSIIQHLR